jgi:hypothetical protein
VSRMAVIQVRAFRATDPEREGWRLTTSTLLRVAHTLMSKWLICSFIYWLHVACVLECVPGFPGILLLRCPMSQKQPALNVSSFKKSRQRY